MSQAAAQAQPVLNHAESTVSPQQVFVPNADNSKAYRNALGCYGTGVTVITANSADAQPVGITVNSFASVSLEPALVLWSVAKSSYRHDTFVAAQHYSIHVLSDQQVDVASRFAQSMEAFDCCQWQSGLHNVPVIEQVVARFDCVLESIHDAGDHAIIIGRVLQVENQGGNPLLFVKGRFQSVATPVN